MKQRYKKSFILIILLLVFIILFLFFLSPEKEFQGYVIKDTNLLVYFPDFPSFWGAIKKQSVANSASKYLFEYLYNIELFFRKKIGIRPTPFRWKIWAGKPFLICWNETGDYLVSFQPTLLFRFLIAPSFYQKHRPHISFKNENLYYLWRGDTLLISNKDNIIQQSVLFSPKSINIDKEKNTAHVELGKKIKVSVSLHAKNNLYIEGKTITNKKYNNFTTPIFNSNNTALSFISSYYPFIDLLSDTSLQHTILSLISEKALQPIFIWSSAFTNTTLENLYRQISNEEILEKSIFFCSGISDKFSTPIPVFGFWFPSENSDIQYLLSTLDLNWTYYPHQWGSYQGYIIPIWNNALCISFLYYEKGWLVCSQEPLMAEILDYTKEYKKTLESPTILTLNFAKISEDIEKILLWSAREELIMGINERDMSSLYSPWKQFFNKLGTFSITTRFIEQPQENFLSIHGEFINEK